MNQRFGFLGCFKNRARTHVSVACLRVHGHLAPVLAAVVLAMPRAPGRAAGVRAILGLATAGLWLGRSWLLPRGAAAACHRVVLHPRSHCAPTAAITQPLLLLTFSLLHARGLAPPAHCHHIRARCDAALLPSPSPVPATTTHMAEPPSACYLWQCGQPLQSAFR